MNSSSSDMTRMTMNTVKNWADGIIAQDNKEGVDKDPALGSMDFKIQVDGIKMSGTLKYDELPDKMKQLKEMALTTQGPAGSINYKRLPDSTEMANIISIADNAEIAVVVDEKKGIYEYHQRTLAP
ncbi:MAG: hypothetical protein AB2L14_36025 [Candidatus Xenobiia bacterium LiM19]